MTQKEKQLLLKDLCARLPYGVRVRFCDGVKEEIDDVWDIDMFSGAINADYIIDDVKPYLRPMSSMTDEEKRKFSIFIGKTEVYVQQVCLDADSMANPIIGGGKCVYWGLFDRCIDWLNEHHFDYRGLIDKGLALETPG